jgi:GntR family transcriptional regulator
MQWVIDLTAPDGLQDQIAACVRRGVVQGELQVGEQLPPAAELAGALSVDRNTVLAAYRRLRDDGVLEFRRGRGATVRSGAEDVASITESTRRLLDLARRQGLSRADVIKLIEEMP